MGKQHPDFGILESKALVIYLLVSLVLSGCGLWKLGELAVWLVSVNWQ